MRQAYASSSHPPPLPLQQNVPGMHHYLPLPPLSLREPAPPLRQPHLITTYSHLPDRSIEPGDASMAYYSPCPIGADLNYGFARRVERREDEEEHLDGVCEALRREWEEGRSGEREGGVITWRGMITRIMTAPYDNEGWEMTAIPLAGSVYIELHDPPDIRAARNKKQSAWAWQSYMGYAFESFSTKTAEGQRDGEDGEGEKWPDGWSGDVNTNVQWCNVVRSAIGEIPLCLGGEVDCVKAEIGAPHPGLQGCIELKTNKVIENERQEGIFHKKMLKHWAQSWLLGIPEVEVGFRDDAGIVRSLRSFDTMTIPRFISSLPYPPWHPSPPLHFLHKTLAMVLHHVLPSDPAPAGGLDKGAELPPAVVWRFSFAPHRGCELWCVGQEGIASNGRWGGVMQEDYVRWRMGRRNG